MLTQDQIEALGWKWPVGGICTREGVITSWPADANGGVLPTQTEIDTWTAEYLARPPDEVTDLRQQAGAAVSAIDTYLAIADTATPAQVREQVKRLSQIMRRVIVRLVQVD